MEGFEMKAKIFLTTIALMMLTGVSLFAQRTTDIKGSKDYPLVSRFNGSVIEWYQVKNFDRYYMLSLKDNKLQPYEIDGKVTRIQYSSQKEHSVFEIYKSYESALKNAGFKILLTLDKNNCGINLSEQLYIGEFNGLNALTDRNSIKPDYREGEFAYLSAKKKINDKEVYIVVYITNWNYPLITFDAVEVKHMDKGLVTVQNLGEGLTSAGHVALAGVYFDTGKSTIKPESQQALKNIADFLKSNTSKKFLIVGHTDNTGDFDANVKLSTVRAQSVVQELVSKYGVNKDQLKAFGVGSASPVANNSTAAGKAKNRRVEIVVQ